MSKGQVSATVGEQTKRRYREIVTPEGVPLNFALARIGERFAALFVDFLVIAVLLFVLGLCLMIPGFGFAGVLLQLALFLIFNFYFTISELCWGGRTLGKRLFGLRVIEGSGRHLRAQLVFTRNLTRNVELWMPVQVILNPEALAGSAPGWGVGLAITWILLLACFPFFNRDRLRIGDLIAGTLVIAERRGRLLHDLAERRSNKSEGLRFFEPQLELYGEYELQVLEGILRQKGTPPAVLKDVAQKIQTKIGWTGPEVDSRVFLEGFYAAQRRRLENKMLLGQRKERKDA